MSLDFSSDRLDTDNPFIDLEMYALKIIAANMIVKDEYLANENETTESLNASSLYMSCKNGTADISMFGTIPRQFLVNVGMHPNQIELYFRSGCDLYYIPKDVKSNGLPTGTTYRADLMELLIPWYIEKYESDNYSGELNNYYRKILGIPPVGEWGIYMKDYEYLMPDNFTYTGDYLHEVGYKTCIQLDALGILDVIKADYPDQDYIKYTICGLDPYTARKKMDFQILYSPRSTDIAYYNSEMSQKMFAIFSEEFLNKYNNNRTFMIDTVYSSAMEVDSEYYHSFMVAYTILITMMDILNEVQSHIIKMDILNRRCIQYIFSMYGVPYYKDVPEKYLEKICRGIHSILKYKSSTTEILNFKKLFGFDSIKFCKYYLVKERLIDGGTGDFIYNSVEKTIGEENTILDFKFVTNSIDSIDNDKDYTEFSIPFPFEYFLQKGNLLIVKLDNTVLTENTDYTINSYNTIRINNSILSDKTNITYMFYYDNTTIDKEFDIDTEDSCNIKIQTYENNSSNIILLDSPPWSDYWINENNVTIILDNEFLSKRYYTIDINSLTLTIDKTITSDSIIQVVYIYCKSLQSRYIKSRVRVDSRGQTKFFIPEPFQYYIINDNEFFLTSDYKGFINPSKYSTTKLDSGSYITIIDSSLFLEEDDYLEFNFIYSKLRSVNNTTIYSMYSSINVEYNNQTEFDIKYPINNFVSCGYLLYIKFLGWYLPTSAYSYTNEKLFLLEESLAMKKGNILELVFVYCNEDITTNNTNNLSIGQQHIQVSKNHQKYFDFNPPISNYNTLNNTIVTDSNGYYLESEDIEIDYISNKITIKDYDMRPMRGQYFNIYYFFNNTGKNRIKFSYQEIASNTNSYSLDYPFYPYLETGNDFLIMNNNYNINRNNVNFNDKFEFSLDKVYNNLSILYIYNSYYENLNISKFIVETRNELVPSDKNYISINTPFENYIEHNWPYFVSYNTNQYLDEDNYDVYENEFYTDPISDLNNDKYGEYITFTFIYLMKEPYVYKKIVEDYEKDFNLQFCKMYIDDLYSTVYLRDKTNYTDYDSITIPDGWWDGKNYQQDSHNTIKKQIFEAKFNYARSKYYGSSHEIGDSDYYNAVIGYFYSMLYDAVLLEEKLVLNIPTISMNESFRLADLFVFMTCLTYVYNDQPDFIIESDAVKYHKYAVGFNFKTNLNVIKDYLKDRRLEYSDYNVWNMIIPTAQIPTIKEFMDIFHTDLDVRNYVIQKKLDSDTFNEYKVWEYIQDLLMNWELDFSFFKKSDGTLAVTYNEFLKDHAYTLYSEVEKLKAMTDTTTRNDAIITLVDDIAYILEKYIDKKILEIVLWRFPGQSALEALSYIMLFVEFYKSYKIQFRNKGANEVIKTTSDDNNDDNTWRAIDNIDRIIETDYRLEYFNTEDEFTCSSTININEDIMFLQEDFDIKENHK